MRSCVSSKCRGEATDVPWGFCGLVVGSAVVCGQRLISRGPLFWLRACMPLCSPSGVSVMGKLKPTRRAVLEGICIMRQFFFSQLPGHVQHAGGVADASSGCVFLVNFPIVACALSDCVRMFPGVN